MNPGKTFSLKPSLRNGIGLFFLSLILIANALILSVIAFRGYYFFDFNSFLDAAWRVYRGQIPYVDFFYHTGPLHLDMLALFFHLFGFGKTALLAFMVVVSSAVTIATFFATQKRIPLVLSLLVTLLAAAGYYWPWPHPCYDFSAHLWGILATAALMTQLPFQTSQKALWTSFFCGAMAVLSLVTKTNIGGAYGLMFFLVLLHARRGGWALLGYAGGALAAGLIALFFWIPSLQSYYDNAFRFYGLERSYQIARFVLLTVWFRNYYWLPLFAVTYATSYLRKDCRELVSLFWGMCFVGLFTLNTGSMRGTDHLPVMGIYLGLGFAVLYQVKPLCETLGKKLLVWAAILILFATTCLQIKISAEGGLHHYWLTNPDYPHGDYPLKAKPFRGWLFFQPDGIILDGIVDYVNQNVPRKDSLLILCELQVVDALTNRDGYKKVPFIWHAGQFPLPDSPLVKTIGEHIAQDPPDWILISLGGPGYEFLNFGFLFRFLGLGKDFENQYSAVKNWGQYILLKRTAPAKTAL